MYKPQRNSPLPFNKDLHAMGNKSVRTRTIPNPQPSSALQFPSSPITSAQVNISHKTKFSRALNCYEIMRNKSGQAPQRFVASIKSANTPEPAVCHCSPRAVTAGGSRLLLRTLSCCRQAAIFLAAILLSWNNGPRYHATPLCLESEVIP